MKVKYGANKARMLKRQQERLREIDLIEQAYQAVLKTAQGPDYNPMLAKLTYNGFDITFSLGTEVYTLDWQSIILGDVFKPLDPTAYPTVEVIVALFKHNMETDHTRLIRVQDHSGNVLWKAK